MLELLEVDVLLMSKLSAFKPTLDTTNPLSSDTELSRVSIELFEKFHTYICEMSRTKAILSELQKGQKKPDSAVKAYIALLNRQETSYLSFPWEDVLGKMRQSKDVVIGLSSIIQNSNFQEFLQTAYRAVTSTRSIQALFSDQKEMQDPKIVALLPRLPVYLANAQSTLFGICTQVNEPFKLLGSLNIFVSKFHDILIKDADHKTLETGMITVISDIHRVLLTQSAEFKDKENELRISEMVDKALNQHVREPIETRALRAILGQYFSNPLQKSLKTPEEGNIFLRTILAEAYPSDFQMEGKLIAPSSRYNAVKFTTLFNKAFGWSKNGDTSIQPNKFDGIAFGMLVKSDKENLLWLVLQASSPCNDSFDEQQKLCVYVSLAEKFQSASIGKHDKAAQALQLALLPAIALVKANKQLEVIFQDNFGPNSKLGGWLSKDKGSRQKYPIALQSLLSDTDLVIEPDRQSQLSHSQEDAYSLSVSESQRVSASALPPQEANVDSEADDDDWDNFSDDEHVETAKLPSPSLEEETDWQKLGRQYWDELVALRDQFQDLEDQVNQQTGSIEEHNKVIQSHQIEIQSLEKSLQTAKSEHEQEMISLRNTIEQLQDRNKQLSDEKRRHAQALEGAKQQGATQQASADAVTIQSQQTKIQSVEDSLRSAQSALEQEKISSGNTIQQLQAQNKQLNADKGKHAQALEEAKQQGVTQQASVDAAAIQALKLQISTLQQEKQGLQAENVQLKSQVAKSSLTDKQVVDILVLCASLENEEKGFVGGFFAKRKQAKRVVLNALVENCKTKPIADALQMVQSQFSAQYAEALKGRHSRTREILEDITEQLRPDTAF